jgi:hypothetical protein
MLDFVRHRPAQQLGVVDVGALRHHPQAAPSRRWSSVIADQRSSVE